MKIGCVILGDRAPVKNQVLPMHLGLRRRYRNNSTGARECGSESIAVGSRPYVERVKKELGFRARARNFEKSGSAWELREDAIPYRPVFGPENRALKENSS